MISYILDTPKSQEEDFSIERLEVPYVRQLMTLTKRAIHESEEGELSPEMLNAIRENLRFVFEFIDENYY